MKLKYFIVFFIIFCFTWNGLAQDHIFVQLYSGEIIYYKLAENPTITYTSAEMNICPGTGSQKSIPIKNIKNIQYTYPNNISVDDGIQTGLIAIYTASGYYVTMIKEYKEINKLYLPFGVYILQSKDSSKKVLLK